MYVLIPPMTQGWVAHLCGRAGGSPGVGEGGPQECWLSSWGAAVRAMTTPWPCSSGVVASTDSWHPSGPSTTHPAVQMGDPWMPMAASCSTQGPPRSKGHPGAPQIQGAPRDPWHPRSSPPPESPSFKRNPGSPGTPQLQGEPKDTPTPRVTQCSPAYSGTGCPSALAGGRPAGEGGVGPCPHPGAAPGLSGSNPGGWGQVGMVGEEWGDSRGSGPQGRWGGPGWDRALGLGLRRARSP